MNGEPKSVTITISALEYASMRYLLRRIANTTCDHGPQEFCPREEAQAILNVFGDLVEPGSAKIELDKLTHLRAGYDKLFAQNVALHRDRDFLLDALEDVAESADGSGRAADALRRWKENAS